MELPDLKHAATMLTEHYDSIIIIGTSHLSGSTSISWATSGNSFANERALEYAARELLEDYDEDDYNV